MRNTAQDDHNGVHVNYSRVGVAIAFAIAAALVIPTVADAASYRTIQTDGSSANVWTQPGRGTANGAASQLFDRYYDNRYVGVVCQAPGEWVTVNGRTSNLWNRLDTGGYVSALLVSGSRADGSDPNVRRCGPQRTLGSLGDGTPGGAYKWALGRLGDTRQSNGQGWAGWCDRFVANAFGKPYSGYETAIAHFRGIPDYLVHRDQNPPVGALVFYGPSGANWQAGHVQLVVGHTMTGKPLYVTSGNEVHLATDDYLPGPYLGWVYGRDAWR